MYRYGEMVINLTRRGYCDAGPCMFVLTVCGYVFVYLCVRSPISQYNFVKWHNCHNTLYRDNRLYMLNPGRSILKIYWWGFALAH